MTWSAPSEDTRSSFAVLHTPVTSAPRALAIWTAYVPCEARRAPAQTGRARAARRPGQRAARGGRHGYDGSLREGQGRRFAGRRPFLAYSANDPGRSEPRRRRRTASPRSRPPRRSRRRHGRTRGSSACGVESESHRVRLAVIRCSVPRSSPAACTRTSFGAIAAARLAELRTSSACSGSA
jgi:hypothetical protein